MCMPSKKRYHKYCTKYGASLVIVRVLQEGIIEDDALVLEESIKVRVRMSRSLASVNHKQLCQRKVDPAGQCLNHGTKLAVRQRIKLVE